VLKVCCVSVIRPKPPEDPLLLHLSGAAAACRQERVAARLEQTRRELLEALDTGADGYFLGQPERLLAAYGTTRSAARRADSELFAVLSAARAIRDQVDRVVYVGDRGACACVEALFATCCHPFHNELSRGERGGRPRLTWLAENWDSDRMQGVLDLVAPSARAHRSDDLLDRWALVAAGAGETASEAAMYHLLRGSLRPTGGSGASPVAEPVAVIPLPGSRLAKAATDCHHCFPLPEGVLGARAFFTAAGLLPAAIVGLDVVRLLEGAASMQRRFREAPPAENPVLAIAAAQPLFGVFLHAHDTRLSTVIAWHEALLAEEGVLGDGETGLRSSLHLRAVAARRDPLANVTDMPLYRGLAQREADARQPAIELPRIDEHSVGQLIQFLLLHTAVARRLAGEVGSGGDQPV
jgi:glucose-6-phosphate isomerase